MIERRLPALGAVPDYSCVLYPDPPSHDFCVWLIIAELSRRFQRAPTPLKVKFGLIDGQLGTVDFGPYSLRSGKAYPCDVSPEYWRLMLANVMRPAIDMIGAAEEVPAHAPFDGLAEWVEYDYHLWQLVDAAREGHAVPRWGPPQWAHDAVARMLGRIRPVVITLRETDVQPERNSNIGAWLRFAQDIQRTHPVLVVRDTCKASEGFFGLPTCSLASLDAYARAALYQYALVNMMVHTGPNVWAIFSDAPYLLFKQLVPALPNWAHGQPQGWREQDHMVVGEQYPWASAVQRLTWSDDTYANLHAAFEQFA
jgi:hypothetical protein